MAAARTTLRSLAQHVGSFLLQQKKSFN